MIREIFLRQWGLDARGLQAAGLWVEELGDGDGGLLMIGPAERRTLLAALAEAAALSEAEGTGEGMEKYLIRFWPAQP